MDGLKWKCDLPPTQTWLGLMQTEQKLSTMLFLSRIFWQQTGEQYFMSQMSVQEDIWPRGPTLGRQHMRGVRTPSSGVRPCPRVDLWEAKGRKLTLPKYPPHTEFSFLWDFQILLFSLFHISFISLILHYKHTYLIINTGLLSNCSSFRLRSCFCPVSLELLPASFPLLSFF